MGLARAIEIVMTRNSYNDAYDNINNDVAKAMVIIKDAYLPLIHAQLAYVCLEEEDIGTLHAGIEDLGCGHLVCLLAT